MWLILSLIYSINDYYWVLFSARTIAKCWRKRERQRFLLVRCWKDSGMTSFKSLQLFSEVLLNTVDTAVTEIDVDPTAQELVCSWGGLIARWMVPLANWLVNCSGTGCCTGVWVHHRGDGAGLSEEVALHVTAVKWEDQSRIQSCRIFAEWSLYLPFFFFFIEVEVWRVARTLSCYMIWQINYMLRVKLFFLVEKCSLFIADLLSLLFHLSMSLKAEIILLFPVLSSLWNTFS